MTRSRLYEWLVYAVLWLQVLLFPLIDSLTEASSSGSGFDWSCVWPRWLGIAPFLALFLVHNLVLVPHLFRAHRIRSYLLATAGVLCLFGFFQYSRPFGPSPRKTISMHSPPDRFGSGKPAEHFGRDFCKSEPGAEHRPPLHGRGGLPRPPVMNIFIALLMLGFNLAVVMLFRFQHEKARDRELEQSNLRHELEYLKAQINPHFFMNMLNNIHGMVETDPAQAQDMILQLSKLMRYVLYDAAAARTPLHKEVAFIANYVALMRRRYSNSKVRIDLRLPESVPESVQVPPLLFIAFIENAFKHGISYRRPSYVDIRLEIAGGHIRFRCENSNAGSTVCNEHGGVGLDNVRKRLALLYGDDCSLRIDERPETYCVTLNIPGL